MSGASLLVDGLRMERIPTRAVRLAGAPVAETRIREVAFVGTDLWAQIDGAVYRLRGEDCRLQISLPPGIRMNRAVERWVEFRQARGMGAIDDSVPSDVRVAGVWVYDAAQERWHSGPWPAAMRCYVIDSDRSREPEDCVIDNPVDGVSFDASSWGDRHFIHACAPDGQRIALDDWVLDLATGWVSSFGRFDEASIPEDLPIIEARGIALDSADFGEAVARDDEGKVWWVRNIAEFGLDHLWERGIRGALGRGSDVIAWVDRRCEAAAFSPDAKRVAFMSGERVWIVDAANPTGPSTFAYTVDTGVMVDDRVAVDPRDDDDAPF
ncbi:hypothetical protein [Polyangium sp. 15x6]|uniref:hypothetical protein n=1 Tax=Polyangium sp. 15x6 TaxID=3042687 RepID=UPI00249C7812|nr:hypothetical protein [Polyangium sp. 15x6]MDI3290481.1 hypothetical protein [Polyangium sp. 15x6]